DAAQADNGNAPTTHADQAAAQRPRLEGGRERRQVPADGEGFAGDRRGTAPQAAGEPPLPALDPVDAGGGAAVNPSAISPQQLRSIVEEKWLRDEEAAAVGLHVPTTWRGPSEVQFDFGKASVVRADTVFQVREALRAAE